MKRKNKNKLSPLALIEAKTTEAISALCLTVEKLREANDDIDIEHQQNVNRIVDLEFQNGYLESTKRRNEKIINNFEKLLGFDLDEDGDVSDIPVDDCNKCDNCNSCECECDHEANG